MCECGGSSLVLLMGCEGQGGGLGQVRVWRGLGLGQVNKSKNKRGGKSSCAVMFSGC